jgi:hypothetical protein
MGVEQQLDIRNSSGVELEWWQKIKPGHAAFVPMMRIASYLKDYQNIHPQQINEEDLKAIGLGCACLFILLAGGVGAHRIIKGRKRTGPRPEELGPESEDYGPFGMELPGSSKTNGDQKSKDFEL